MQVRYAAMACLMALCAACGNARADTKVVTTFYPLYIMAKNVCRDVPGVRLENLAPAVTGCLHDYALTAADMKKLTGARLVVANGAGMESFLDTLSAGHPGITVVKLTDGIPLLQGPGNQAANPHVWVSIDGCIAEVRNLGRALAMADPAHGAWYAKNTAAYVAKLEALQETMQAALAPYKGREIITFHEAFPYFAREFGLRIAAVVEREPGSEPSARELAATAELVRKNKAAALFSEPQYPDVAARTIARETNARVYVLDPAVTGPDDYDAYVTIMQKNLTVLKEALGKGDVTP